MNPPARTSGDPRSAARARLAALVVNGQEVADLALEGRRDALLQDLDRVGERRPRRHVQRVDLLGRQARPLAERQQAGGMEDLVAVGVADPGHERLVAQQVLELARMAPDPLAPDLEGQRRVVRVGALVGLAEARHRAIDAGRAQVDLAHLGRVPIADLDRGVGRWEPRRPSRPARAVDGDASRGPKPRTTAVLAGSLSPGRRQLESAGQHRVAGDRIALEVDQQELPAPPHCLDPLANQCLQLGRSTTHGERSRRVSRTDLAAGERGVERIGDHGQIG